MITLTVPNTAPHQTLLSFRNNKATLLQSKTNGVAIALMVLLSQAASAHSYVGEPGGAYIPHDDSLQREFRFFAAIGLLYGVAQIILAIFKQAGRFLFANE